MIWRMTHVWGSSMRAVISVCRNNVVRKIQINYFISVNMKTCEGMESIAVASKTAVSIAYMCISSGVCEQIMCISYCQVTKGNLWSSHFGIWHD